MQRSLVKIYGAGGLQGLEAYQSGFIVSDEGHVATADSLVLEQGEVIVVSAAGNRYAGRVLGSDPLLRVAVVKIGLAGEALGVVDLDQPAEPRIGAPLLTFTNLFNIAAGAEPASVMRTHLAAIVPREVAFGSGASRGTDRLLLVDSVTSNPGAAGGLLTDYRGRPVGMIGVEHRGRVTGGWLNYALPAAQVSSSVRRILQGDRFLDSQQDTSREAVNPLEQWGFAMVETVAARTPPFVEFVRPGSPAAEAGVQADDLLVMVDGMVTATTIEAQRLLTLRSGGNTISLTLQREGELIEVELPGVKAPAKGKESL